MRAFAAFLGLGLAVPAAGQGVVVSPAPDRVAVTVYRDPSRGADPLRRNWLNGYALISETRTVTIPAGEAELRFEGVASGTIPQSAIVGGIPEGLLERNRDAYLLSAGSLLDRALGRRVTLRRTDAATGAVRSEEAIVRSGSAGGVVLQTAAGFEALRCSGIAETPLYSEIPAGLSARPTLSVRVRARQPLRAALTLSYLASGFDWQADYVGTLAADGRTLDLQAWLTLASTDDTSFRDATTQAVAGKVNRSGVRTAPIESPPLRLRCWPGMTTSDVPQQRFGDAPDTRGYALGRATPAPPPPPAPATAMASEIVVTGSRMMSESERLGDLQLYRVPQPVTVAANAQKQVGLIDQPAVRVRQVYAFPAGALVSDGVWRPATLRLETENRAASGLGLPLPAGNVVVLGMGAGRPVLLGEARLDDTAVGERVRLDLAGSPVVQGRRERDGEGRQVLTVTNAAPAPVAVEVALGDGDSPPVALGGERLVRRDGLTLWQVTVPANASRTLRLGRATP